MTLLTVEIWKGCDGVPGYWVEMGNAPLTEDEYHHFSNIPHHANEVPISDEDMQRLGLHDEDKIMAVTTEDRELAEGIR